MRRRDMAMTMTAIAAVIVLIAYVSKPSSSLQPPAAILAPPMGFNPYNHFGNEVSEVVIEQVADAMARNGMLAAGYQYVNIDDSWQGARDARGNLTTNSQFPSGIKAVADYVHRLGLKLGIYTTPASTSCGGHTGSQGHARQDAEIFAAWGVDYIKLDWCGAAADAAQAAGIAKDWSSAIARTKRPMVLSINAGRNDVGSWASRSVNSWRTDVDICASWYNRTRAPNNVASSCYDRTNYNGIFDYLNSDTASQARYVRQGRYADPDMLEVGNAGLSFDEAKTNFSMWAMWSAPLLAGSDPRTMVASDSTSTILLNRQVIAVDQDSLAIPAAKVQDYNGIQVWVKPLSDGSKAVALVNASPSDRTISASVSASDVGLTRLGSIHDLWTNKEAKTVDAKYVVSVPAHGTIMLKIEQ